MRAGEVLEVVTPPCRRAEWLWISRQRRTISVEFRKGLIATVDSTKQRTAIAYCAGEELNGTKPRGGSETTGGDCTRGVSTLGNGRLCASSALSMPY